MSYDFPDLTHELDGYLDETGDFDREADALFEEVFPDLRGLVVTGGKPYILIVLEEPESGGVDVSHLGIDPQVIPEALRQIADLIEAP
jgi:hypothetical protein